MKFKYRIIFFILFTFLFSYNEAFLSWENDLKKNSPKLESIELLTKTSQAEVYGLAMFPDAEIKWLPSIDTVTISQMIPFPSRIISKHLQLSFEYKKSKEGYKQHLWQHRASFRKAYLMAWFYFKRLKISSVQLVILQQIVADVESRVISGRLPNRELIIVNVERDKLQINIKNWQRELTNAVELVNQLAGNSLSHRDIISSLTSVKILLPKKFLPLNITNAPTIKITRYDLLSAQSILSANWQSFLPSLMLEYRQPYNGIADTQISLNATIPITAWTKAGQIAGSRKRIQAIKRQQKEELNKLRLRADTLLRNYFSAYQEYILYRDNIFENLKQYFAELKTSYVANGAITTTDFITAFNDILTAELNIYFNQIKTEGIMIDLETLMAEKRAYFFKDALPEIN